MKEKFIPLAVDGRLVNFCKDDEIEFLSKPTVCVANGASGSAQVVAANGKRLERAELHTGKDVFPKSLERGLKAFAARKEGKSGIYSHEQRVVDLPQPYLGLLTANKKAWVFFQNQARSYRKAAIWWVTSAKKEETRKKRLDSLIAYSAKAEKIPQFTWKKSARGHSE